MQCQAKSKNTGVQCRRSAVNGKRVCTVHGGLTPSGIASPNFKHGRYSKHMKHLPPVYQESYMEHLANPDLMSLRDDIALMDSRVDELFQDLSKLSGSADIWKALQKAWSNFLVANRKKNHADMQRYLNELDSIISAGDVRAGIWSSIMVVKEQKRKIQESELKRLTMNNLMITNEQAISLFYRVLMEIKEGVETHIQDKDIARAFLSQVSSRMMTMIQVEDGE